MQRLIEHAHSTIKRRRYARKAQAQQRKELKQSRRGRQFKAYNWLCNVRRNRAQELELSRLATKLGVSA